MAEPLQSRPRHPGPDVRAQRRADDVRRNHAAAVHQARPPISTARSSLNRGDPAGEPAFFMFQATAQAAESRSQQAGRISTSSPDRAGEDLSASSIRSKFTVRVVGWAESIVGQFKTTLYTLAAAVALAAADRLQQRRQHAARAAARRESARWRFGCRSAPSRFAGRAPAARRESAAGHRSARSSAVSSPTAASRRLVLLIPDGLIPREAEIRVERPGAGVQPGHRHRDGPGVRAWYRRCRPRRRDMVEAAEEFGQRASAEASGAAGCETALVVAEVALVAHAARRGAGLLMRSFVKLQTRDLGFNPDNILGRAAAAASRSVQDGRRQAAVLRSVARATARAAGRGRGYRNVDAAALWRDPQRCRDSRASRQAEQRQAIVPVVQRGLLRHAWIATRSADGPCRKTKSTMRGAVAVVNQTLVDRFFGVRRIRLASGSSSVSSKPCRDGRRSRTRSSRSSA